MRSSRIAPTNIKSMKLNKENIKTVSTFPGIYLIVNDLNNKKYVGQSINLQKRLLKHCEQSSHIRYNNPLYRAVLKYGLNNFSFEILEILETDDFTNAKKKLDELEIKYISDYNTYNNGYNQTLGGDGGILGYKMTDEQKQHVSENSKRLMNDGRNIMWVYDIKTKLYHMFISSKYAEKLLGVRNDVIRKWGQIHYGRYISGKTEEEVRSYVKNFNDDQKRLNTGLFTQRISKEKFLEACDQFNSIKEIIKHLGICRKTYYNYANLYFDGVSHKLGIDNGMKKHVVRYDSNKNIIAEYDSILSAAKDILKNKELKTSDLTTIRQNIRRNKNKFWLNSYWKIE